MMSTMSHKERDVERDEKPSERRNRDKREKDPNRPHKSRSSKSSRPIDPETGEPVKSSHRRKKEKEPGSEPSRSMADVLPELSRTSSAPGAMARETFPYPSLSKAHSKEAVYSLVDVSKPDAPNVYTPDSTDIGEEKKSRSNSRESLKVKTEAAAQTSKDRPPTPPDTELSQQRKSSTSTSTRANKIREEEEKHARPSSRSSERSWFGRPKIIRDDKSKVSTKSRESKASTARRTSKPKVEVVEVVDDDYMSDETHSQSGLDSNATSVAPKRSPPQSTATGSGGRSPGLDTDSGQSNRESASPRTPTATPKFDSDDPKHFARDIRPTPSPFVSFDIPEAESDAYDSPMPPPPPPPPVVPMNIPRVDYLMQNGGLSRIVPKALLAVTPSYTGQPAYPGRAAAPGPPDIEKVFGPFYGLLDQYETVLAKNGSVAVATGYRSIARKLLDRLENVFARELSSEGCTCIMCEQNEDGGTCHNRALGWGDVLEWVSGRRSLPAWPAFDFGAMGVNTGLGISGHHRSNSDGRPPSPQKIDPDIAEEFREHYLRQSKKTKVAVDKWLSSTPASAAAPPPDIDDETLTFTILTHLDAEDRPIFNALLTGSNRPVQSASRAPTPMGKLRSDFIVKTSQALQRLYRLPQPPRDPEATIYLLKNPELHHLLVTLSLINNSEWEILISGRFDGFLWSGADTDFPDSVAPSPAPSRGPTPANLPPSRGPTPAGRHSSFSRTFSPTPAGFPQRTNTFSPPIAGFPSRGPTPSLMAPMSVPGTPFQGGRHPVSNDEEMEIAVLAEVEREIYAGMEALEDAFEALHRKAEFVRQALRQRGAGLSMAAQSRRGDAGAFARLGTPGMEGAAGYGAGYGYGVFAESEASESEWGEEGCSEIAPDDSASNISSSRHRRPKRRNERRTPAPVEEEDEDEE